MSRPVLGSDAAAQFVYTPALSVAHVSICDTRLRAFDFASESWPFFCWPRKAGRAIAARMPMIRITTRSSMSVKPFSSLLIRWESFRSIALLLGARGLVRHLVQPPRRFFLVAARPAPAG